MFYLWHWCCHNIFLNCLHLVHIFLLHYSPRSPHFSQHQFLPCSDSSDLSRHFYKSFPPASLSCCQASGNPRVNETKIISRNTLDNPHLAEHGQCRPTRAQVVTISVHLLSVYYSYQNSFKLSSFKWTLLFSELYKRQEHSEEHCIRSHSVEALS